MGLKENRKVIPHFNQEDFTQLREKAGISQRELARRSGVDQYTISEWESGKAIPRSVSFRRVYCVLLDIFESCGGN